MFERFSDQARRAVVLAQEDARRRRFGEIRTENILMGVCAVPDGPAVAILAACGLVPDDVDADVTALPPTGLPDAHALATLGIDLDAVRRTVEAAFGPGALQRTGRARGRYRRRRQRARGGHIPFTRAAKEALELALREALALKHRHIGTEHLLLGLLRAEEGGAHRVLTARGVTLARVRAALIDPGAAAG